MLLTNNQQQIGEGARASSDIHLRDWCRQFLVKVVENEIGSAFIFLEVARHAYLVAEQAEGQAAFIKAEAIHAQAQELALRSGEGAPLINDRLRELGAAIQFFRKINLEAQCSE